MAKYDVLAHIPLNSSLADIHEQKCLGGSCEVQHHTQIHSESLTPMHWIIVIQTSVLTMDHSVACEPAPSSLVHCWWDSKLVQLQWIAV